MTNLSLVSPEEPAKLSSNVEAEMALLGAILLNNDALKQVPPSFRAEHFYEPLHQRIYTAVIAVVAAGMTASPITLKARFTNDPALRDVAGDRYLFDLANSVTMIHVRTFCELIQKSWMQRQMLDLYRNSLGALASPEADPDQIAADSRARLEAIISEAFVRSPVTDREVTERILKRLQTSARPFSTGIPVLDEAMGGGLFPGNLYGFAAKQKAGKTVMAGTISHNLRTMNCKHLFICAEMSAENIYQRILARMMNCYESDFRSEKGKEPAFQQRLVRIIEESASLILFEDKPGITLSDLQALISYYVSHHKITGFILDYWQLVRGKQKNETDAKHLDNVAQCLADMCKRHGIWGITMAQINRQGDFRDGDGLLNACEQGYILHRMDDSMPQAWLEMKVSRYTTYKDIGSEMIPGLYLKQKGPYFEQFQF